VSLRRLRAADLDALRAWLPRVAAETGCERWAAEREIARAPQRRGVLRYEDRAGGAFLACSSGPGRGSARIDLLAVAPDQRRLGIGGRAALALERRLARSTRRVYVAVPSRLGLALYFWLRLGYRPLTQQDWPAPPPERAATWLVRELG
jgi:GNAT superfamily N-acetyltransferase